MKNQSLAKLVSLAFLAILTGTAAAAQSTDKTRYDPDGGFGTGAGYAPDNGQVGGQSLDGANGDMFMEEVLPAKQKPKPKPIPIDLSRVGVSVDPHGNIVPLRDDPSAPWAGSGVKPFYNKIETSTTLPYVVPNYPYAGPFVSPYGYGAPYGYGSPLGFGSPYGYGSPFGYGSPYGYGSPFGYGGYGGFGGYGGYGGGGWRSLIPGMVGAAVNAFNGYPPYYSPYFANPYLANPYFNNPYFNNPYFGNPYYSGYSPYSVGYMSTGNSAEFISNDPVTGAPLPQGPNNQTQFSTGSASFTPGPWWPTTNYSQNSMWKAFNLAF